MDSVVRDAVNQGILPGPRYLANAREIARRGGELAAEITAFADGMSFRTSGLVKVLIHSRSIGNARDYTKSCQNRCGSDQAEHVRRGCESTLDCFFHILLIVKRCWTLDLQMIVTLLTKKWQHVWMKVCTRSRIQQQHKC